ncbi:EamA-like transporter family protein [Candidatus Arcanobacter lacustris]|uniref:S-adenosylmethionine uptake transporter n=1 Tax=Candidatus Arcanibacter lacustris TaxID=1607817 RepID=A0A0F5MQA7_9RICK|nr:EamA-like transporter family protein [Candidatus Arcanobacter lacustris]
MSVINNEYKGLLFGLTSGVFYGAIGFFSYHILKESSVYNMLFWRFAIASIIMTVVSTIYLKVGFTEIIKSISKSTISDIFLYAGSTIFFFVSTLYIGTGLTMVILFIYPILVICLDILLNQERTPKVYYFSAIITLIGLAMQLKKNDASHDSYGIILALCSAASYAIYIFTHKYKRQVGSSSISTIILCYGCTIFFFIAAMLDNSLSFPASSKQWIFLISLSTICTILPIVFFLKSIKYLSASKASLLSILEPVSGMTVAFYVLGEKITHLQAVGIVLILMGGMLVQFDMKKIKNYFIYKYNRNKGDLL